MKSKVLKSFKCYDTVCKLVRYPVCDKFYYYVELKTSLAGSCFCHDYASYDYADAEFKQMLNDWMF